MQQGYKQGDLSLFCLTLYYSAGRLEWEAFALWTFFVSCRGHASSRAEALSQGQRKQERESSAQTAEVRQTHRLSTGWSVFLLPVPERARFGTLRQTVPVLHPSHKLRRAACLLLVCHVHAFLQTVCNAMEAKRLRQPRAEEHVLQLEILFFSFRLCEVEVESPGEEPGQVRNWLKAQIAWPTPTDVAGRSSCRSPVLVSSRFSIPKDLPPFSHDTRTSPHHFSL